MTEPKKEEVRVWAAAGLTGCKHPELKETRQGLHRFLNCSCGFHETWETQAVEEPWKVAFVPTGTWERYVSIEARLLMTPLAVEALLNAGHNDPAQTARIAAVMLEGATLERSLLNFAKKED